MAYFLCANGLDSSGSLTPTAIVEMIEKEATRASGAESVLQKDVGALETKTDGFESRNTAFATDGSITEIYGDKKIVTDFVSDTQIVQKLYVNDVLTKTKTINFSTDGTTITEEVA